MKEQAQSKGALQLWAKVCAAFEKGGANAVADLLEKLAEVPSEDRDGER